MVLAPQASACQATLEKILSVPALLAQLDDRRSWLHWAIAALLRSRVDLESKQGPVRRN